MGVKVRAEIAHMYIWARCREQVSDLGSRSGGGQVVGVPWRRCDGMGWIESTGPLWDVL